MYDPRGTTFGLIVSADQAPTRPPVKYIDIDLPDDKTDEVIIADAVAGQRETREQLRDVEAAWAPADEVEAALLNQLDQLASEPPIAVSWANRKPRIEFAWQALPDVATVVAGHVATIPDTAALIARFHRDDLVAEIEQQVAQQYATAPLVMSTAERAEAITRLQAELLHLERIEAAAIWRARAEGRHIPFRANIDVRALLGVQ
jgi:hypothetical protein